MSARDRLEEGELDVPRPNAPGELTPAKGTAERPQPQSLDEPRSRGEARAELWQRVEGGWEPRKFEAPRAEFGRFDPKRAELPPISLDAATNYVRQHRTQRPWLAI